MHSLSLFLLLAGSAPFGVQSGLSGDSLMHCTRVSDDVVIRRVQESRAFQDALVAIGNTRSTARLLQSDIDQFCQSMSSESPARLGGRALVSFPAIPTVEIIQALFGVGSGEVVLLNPVIGGKLQVGLAASAWKSFVGGRPGLVIAGSLQYIEYACLLYGLLENSFPKQPCDGEEEFHITSLRWDEVLVVLARLRFRIILRADGTFERVSV